MNIKKKEVGCGEMRNCLKKKQMPTEATSAVDPPSLAAATHWLAPLPPYFLTNEVPIIVSPDLGNRGEKLKSDDLFFKEEQHIDYSIL